MTHVVLFSILCLITLIYLGYEFYKETIKEPEVCVNELYRDALQQLEQAHCNFNNSLDDPNDYYFHQIKSAEALIDNLRHMAKEDLAEITHPIMK